jgi:hypothetical protein
VVQAVESLLCNGEALSSNPILTKKIKQKNEYNQRWKCLTMDLTAYSLGASVKDSKHLG